MTDRRTAQECALVRAAAEEILTEGGGGGGRSYLQMARGTLAALDWVEGRRRLTPSTGEPRRPDDEITNHGGSRDRRLTALVDEIIKTSDWGSGNPYAPPPNEDIDYHGAVWALLRWWRSNDPLERPAIGVPDLPRDGQGQPG